MINFILSVIFVLSSNIDNIAVGISLALKNIYITLKNNILISFTMALITALSMYFGKILSLVISTKTVSYAGPIILIAIGIYYILKFMVLSNSRKNNLPKEFYFKDFVALTFALASNNIAVGIIASMSGINIFYTFILTFIFSYFFLYIGNRIGKNLFNSFLQKYAELLSSMLLILLGIIQILII